MARLMSPIGYAHLVTENVEPYLGDPSSFLNRGGYTVCPCRTCAAQFTDSRHFRETLIQLKLIFGAEEVGGSSSGNPSDGL